MERLRNYEDVLRFMENVDVPFTNNQRILPTPILPIDLPQEWGSVLVRRWGACSIVNGQNSYRTGRMTSLQVLNSY